MKKLLSAIVSGVLAFGNLPVLTGLAESQNSALWEKFLRYDLCITDYNARSEEEKELCRFIFDTEQAANDNIVCERARRILAGDDVGERITLEELESAYGLWDSQSVYNNVYMWHTITVDGQSKSSSYHNGGWQAYIDRVPDVIRLEPEFCMEYWLDDVRNNYVVFQEKYSPDTIHQFVVYDKDDEPIQTIPSVFDCAMKDFRGDAEYMEQFGLIEKNGGYYYTKSDGTAVFAWSDASGDESQEKIIEPFVIESEINDCPVTAIEHGAFKYAPFTEIVLPDTLEIIDYDAFSQCKYLETINFPNGLKYIGSKAFFNCNSLNDIQIDCPELKIAGCAFYGLQGLKTANINAEEIGERAFYCCTILESVTLGEDITGIGAKAFWGDTLLDEITLPNSVEIIGQGALPNCISVTIPPSVKVIGAYSAKGANEVLTSFESLPIRPLTDEPICAFDSDCVIYGYEGTEAERYAKEWDLEFSAMEYTAGDVNFDGVFSIADVIALQKWLTEGKEPVYWKAADYHQDNRLTASDFTLMKRALLKVVIQRCFHYDL